MLCWLQVPKECIQNTLKFEYKIKVRNLPKCIPQAFAEIEESDLQFLKKYFSDEASQCFDERMVETKKCKNIVCNICRRKDSKKSQNNNHL